MFQGLKNKHKCRCLLVPLGFLVTYTFCSNGTGPWAANATLLRRHLLPLADGSEWVGRLPEFHEKHQSILYSGKERDYKFPHSEVSWSKIHPLLQSPQLPGERGWSPAELQ